jgi:hypothetical protein
VKNRHLYILAALLASAGLGLFLYKALVLELPLRPAGQVQNWEVEARIRFTAHDAAVKLSLFSPRNDRSLTVIDQSFVSEGYGLTTASEGDNRRALLSIRSAAGEQTVYYRFVVHRAPVSRERAEAEDLIPERPHFSEVHLEAARGLLRDLKAKSADDETLVRLVLKQLGGKNTPDEAATLLGFDPTPRKRMVVAAQMLALAGIAARPVNGVQLVDFARDAAIAHWLEAFVDGRWQSFWPQSDTGVVPANSFPWWRGAAPLAALEGGDDLRTTLTISSASVPALRNALAVDQARSRSLLGYSLFTLPLATQQVYKIILTLPIGVFLLAALRNVVGLRTFGTFMPVLIALAFRETHVLWGMFLFTLVVSIGLLVRLYLANLRLLVVPRLASVLIVVVLTMAAISVLSNQLGLQRGLSVALFPMVIMTMTVERMSIIWDERGPAEMLRLGVGSLAVAAVAHLVMVNAYVEHLCLVFPELLLVVLACTLLLGRYSGYRLFDLARFRVLGGRGS